MITGVTTASSSLSPPRHTAPNHPLAARSANGGGGRGDYYARKYRCAAGLGANAVTLEDCFSKFTKPERLDEDNHWCGRHVTAVERSCNVPERLDEDNHWCGRRVTAVERSCNVPERLDEDNHWCGRHVTAVERSCNVPERLDEDNHWCGRRVTAVERSCNVPERLDEDNHWCGRRRAAAPRTARGPFWFSSLSLARTRAGCGACRLNNQYTRRGP